MVLSMAGNPQSADSADGDGDCDDGNNTEGGESDIFRCLGV